MLKHPNICRANPSSSAHYSDGSHHFVMSQYCQKKQQWCPTFPSDRHNCCVLCCGVCVCVCMCTVYVCGDDVYGCTLALTFEVPSNPEGQSPYFLTFAYFCRHTRIRMCTCTPAPAHTHTHTACIPLVSLLSWPVCSVHKH